MGPFQQHLPVVVVDDAGESMECFVGQKNHSFPNATHSKYCLSSSFAQPHMARGLYPSEDCIHSARSGVNVTGSVMARSGHPLFLLEAVLPSHLKDPPLNHTTRGRGRNPQFVSHYHRGVNQVCQPLKSCDTGKLKRKHTTFIFGRRGIRNLSL